MGLSFVAPLAGRDQGLLRNSKRRLHFNPRAPCGARQSGTPIAHATTPFQSTHPLRGATARRPKMTMRPQKFQSTHPLRGATLNVNSFFKNNSFQSTHPLRGATRIAVPGHDAGLISIHAPLAGCDKKLYKDFDYLKISIHAPLAGCDSAIIMELNSKQTFQSTHPLRGATFIAFNFIADELRFQSTHPLRGATPYRRYKL